MDHADGPYVNNPSSPNEKYLPLPPITIWSKTDIPSTAFRKFIISYGRLFGHGILGYREQSRDEFSRPFGKEAPYANAHCSPHHFIAKRSYGSASGCACPFHTTITGVTRTHCLKGG